ncbi:MAG: pyroglutamyl-peptidase I [Rhodoferax sp.]|nr:pyroglutamyl-peptidase I [Rhodoferax sp.]
MSTPPPNARAVRKAGPSAKNVAAQRAETILLTGFEPFDGDAVNPSWLLAQALHGRQVAGHRIVASRLPTAFGASAALLARLIQVHRPALVLCLGLAGGRQALSLERVAININDARIPDNLGGQPVDTAVIPNGPAAYFSSLPIKAMLLAIRETGVPAEVSNSAGTFVCNHVFYALMHLLTTGRGLRRVRGGFMHLPWLPGQALAHQSAAGVALPDMVLGLRAALRAALLHTGETDIRLAAGAND